MTVPARDLLSNPEKFDDLQESPKGAQKAFLSPNHCIASEENQKEKPQGYFLLKKKVGMALRPRGCAHQTAVPCITEVPNNGMAGAKGV